MKIWVRPPKLAQAYAKKGLAAREEAAKSDKCCTRAGLARAQAILDGDRQDAVDIRGWFRRHHGNYEKAAARAARKGLTLREAAPDEPAIQAWWIWGGGPMWRAAEQAVARERQENPSWLALGVAAVTAFTAGAAGTFRGLGGNPEAIDPGEYIELDEYEGAILLFPTADTWVGKTVDYFTGEKGFSHVALDVGLVNQEGEPLYLDSWGTEGVNLRTASFFDREPLRYPLTPKQSAHARSVGLHLLHSRTPYRGRRGGKTCSEFVVACMPRSFVRQLHLPRDPTPNDLAMALGLAQISELK